MKFGVWLERLKIFWARWPYFWYLLYREGRVLIFTVFPWQFLVITKCIVVKLNIKLFCWKGAIHKLRTQVGEGVESWRRRMGAYRWRGVQIWWVRTYFDCIFSIFKDFLDKKEKWEWLRKWRFHWCYIWIVKFWTQNCFRN